MTLDMHYTQEYKTISMSQSVGNLGLHIITSKMVKFS
jgi:hypothetical protein